MIAALISYPRWNHLAAESAGRFPLPPDATEAACEAELASLPAHPVKVHLFERPLTLSTNAWLGPAQFLSAVLGVMAVRFRGDSGFRLGRGRYLIHGGEKTSPADCLLLELSTADGNRATCVIAAARRGGTLNVTLGSVARERYGLTRWLLQRAAICGIVGGFLLFFLIFMVGLRGDDYNLVGYFFLAVSAPVIAQSVRLHWKQGAVPSRDNKTMPSDGESFVTLIGRAVDQIVKSGPEQALAEAGWRPNGASERATSSE